MYSRAKSSPSSAATAAACACARRPADPAPARRSGRPSPPPGRRRRANSAKVTGPDAVLGKRNGNRHDLVAPTPPGVPSGRPAHSCLDQPLTSARSAPVSPASVDGVHRRTRARPLTVRASRASDVTDSVSLPASSAASCSPITRSGRYRSRCCRRTKRSRSSPPGCTAGSHRPCAAARRALVPRGTATSRVSPSGSQPPAGKDVRDAHDASRENPVATAGRDAGPRR